MRLILANEYFIYSQAMLIRLLPQEGGNIKDVHSRLFHGLNGGIAPSIRT
jgi:hypothetical protein